MKTSQQKNEILNLRTQGYSYRKISKMIHLSRDCVRGICLNRKILHPKKRGRKSTLTKAHKLCIKRQISNLKKEGQKVYASKLINLCELSVSRFTISRHLKAINMRYQKVNKVIPLKLQDKNKRVELAKQWIIENHSWEKTIFSDEKWFSFDGPDGWASYMYPNEEANRPKRQKRGGGVMVWAIILPNGLISYRFLNRSFKSTDYINLLQNVVVPIAKLNLGNNFWFQHDNARIHTAKIVKQWMESSLFNVLNWPVRSPDLNPVENIWKMIDDMVYDRLPFNSAEMLKKSIEDAILQINLNKRYVICNMYKCYRKRLLDVIEKCGKQL